MGGGVELGRKACLGEWRGRGKVITIFQADDEELLVDMGPGVPSLTLLAMNPKNQAWPMTWAVVRQPERSSTPGSQQTVYIFELPSLESSQLLVKKPTGDGVVEFERIGPPPATNGQPTQAKKDQSRSRSPRARGKMSFADSLAKIVSEKKVSLVDREKMSQQWLDYESKLLDSAVELFKQRCIREAENQRCGATVSFEVLSREIDAFPKRTLSGSTYYVGTWGEGICAESWYYATRGLTANFQTGVQVLFAEVLQGMLPKFVDRVKMLGFQSCSHEAGTWKITVAWRKPEPEPGDGEAKDA